MLTLEGVGLSLEGFTLTANLEIPDAAHVAVIGPSGAGKSTLLGLLAGYLTPDRGRILWNGRDITPDPPAQRPVSVLFQDNNLFPHLTASQNVGLGIRPDLRLTPEERQKVDNALAHVGLPGMGERKPAALSGGQQSRVALARILVQRRPVILLDEPFSALGPALKADMLGLVTQLAKETGATLITVTHEPADAAQWFGQALLVADGVAHPLQPVRDLLANPPDALADYLGEG